MDSNLRCRSGFYGRISARVWRAIRPDKKHPCWREFVRPWIRLCFGFLRFASFAKLERRCSATSEIRPKLRFKSERLDHRHPVSVAHRLDGANAADGAQSDDGGTLAGVLS